MGGLDTVDCEPMEAAHHHRLIEQIRPSVPDWREAAGRGEEHDNNRHPVNSACIPAITTS